MLTGAIYWVALLYSCRAMIAECGGISSKTDDFARFSGEQ